MSSPSSECVCVWGGGGGGALCALTRPFAKHGQASTVHSRAFMEERIGAGRKLLGK